MDIIKNTELPCKCGYLSTSKNIFCYSGILGFLLPHYLSLFPFGAREHLCHLLIFMFSNCKSVSHFSISFALRGLLKKKPGMQFGLMPEGGVIVPFLLHASYRRNTFENRKTSTLPLQIWKKHLVEFLGAL